MYDTKRLLINITGVLAVSIIGAILMMGVDDAARWLKYLPYALFFASISSPAVFSSHTGCSSMLRHLRK